MDKGSVEKAFEMRCEGALISAIALKLGHSESAVSNALQKAGIADVLAKKKAALLGSISAALDAGRSYIQIADDLAMTRSQIAGLINRNLRSSIRRQPAAAAAKSASATRGNTRRRVIASSGVAADTPTPLQQATQPVPVAMVLVVESSPVAFALAGPGICGWPLWSATEALAAKTVCGTACGRETYCPGHRALAYRPAETRRRAA